MKRESRLVKAFGSNNAGLADVPRKWSGVKVSRVVLDPDPVLGPPRVGKIRLQLLLFFS